MKLKNLKLYGYKNLKSETGQFILNFENNTNVTVLIGNNGSGKSNILEAVSAIFKSLYLISDYQQRVNFEFEISYDLPYGDDGRLQNIYISFIRNRYIIRSSADGRINQDVLVNYLPSQVIALYSGEELRLWKSYYEKFYLDYNNDVIAGRTYIENNQKMLYINKYYWDIALLTMIISDVQVNDIIGDINLASITLEIDNTNLNRFKEGSYNEVVSFVDNFYFDKDANRIPESPTLTIVQEELQDRFNSETHRRLFNLLCVAKLPKNKDNKLISGLELVFDNGLTTKDFSEGEKKKILLRLVLKILADNNSLILLDEPDSHIHVAHKKQIKDMLEESEIDALLTTHSPTLMNVFGNNLVYLENGQIKGSEKAEILKEISGDTMSDAQRQILLNSNTDILIVEGKTDEKYITTALEKLKTIEDRYNNLDFNFLYMGGSDSENLKKLIEQFPPKGNQTIIAFFDNDGAGYGCIQKAFEYTSQKQDFTRSIENGIHICIYPKKDGFTKSDFEIEDYFKIDLALFLIP